MEKLAVQNTDGHYRVVGYKEYTIADDPTQETRYNITGIYSENFNTHAEAVFEIAVIIANPAPWENNFEVLVNKTL